MIFLNNRGVVIDETIEKAIQKTLSSFESLSEAARRTGVDRGSLAFLKGVEGRKAKIISFSTWEKLSPYLETLGGLEIVYPEGVNPPSVSSVRYGISDGPDVEPDDLPPMPDMKSLARAGVSSSPKRFYFDGVPHSEPSSSDFLSRLMSCDDIPADVKVVIFQEHEKFLSDYGTKRHDSAQHGTLAQFSTGGEETNV
jgi:hypothetical protein